MNRPAGDGWAGVGVPATSANLGPAFDSAGLALELRDEVWARRAFPTRVHVEGEGAGLVPTGVRHLVLRALRRGLEECGEADVALELCCRNAIPHARGLGSSAAAVVAGLGLARALAHDPAALDDDALLRLAVEFEGHPDNAAPALRGGATLCYTDGAGPHAVALTVADDLQAVAWIPATQGKTSDARAALPEAVPFADAAFSASRAALLGVALSRPELLFAATDDRLHQPARARVMPASARLISRLRDAGVAAVLSGAGPTVLSFGAPPDALRTRAEDDGWSVRLLDVARVGLQSLDAI